MGTATFKVQIANRIAQGEGCATEDKQASGIARVLSIVIAAVVRNRAVVDCFTHGDHRCASRENFATPQTITLRRKQEFIVRGLG